MSVFSRDPLRGRCMAVDLRHTFNAMSKTRTSPPLQTRIKNLYIHSPVYTSPLVAIVQKFVPVVEYIHPPLNTKKVL